MPKIKDLNAAYNADGNAEKTEALDRLVKKITKENLWIYILRLLQDKPHYGYEIRKNIKEKFGFSPATVSGYVILYKMKNDHLIEEVKVEDEEAKESGKPNRTYYAITELGKQSMRNAKEYLQTLLNDVFDLTE
ncbi:MAG: PadR family transcriptional regulator [Candidatus Helarchaeales archaeon]